MEKTMTTRPSDARKGPPPTEHSGPLLPQAQVIPPSSATYFHPTVDDHFRRETDVVRNHENWLETYEPMIIRNAENRKTTLDGRLRPIDEVFRLIRTAPSSIPTAMRTSRQRTSGLTTRPINT
ncbi:hypothetical protein IV203_031285 [Nitzschia inconspicua]|uniref:Uncharacterized protein n=1 Tax=Nitzschia inconspicua TaxID=303405 RepID=A0A9K3LUY3_9STRA|nr:hypothetical protein IV203_031285 [Nitzschia inconspicua]